MWSTTDVGRQRDLRLDWILKRLLLAAALVYEPDGSDAHLVFQMRPGAYNHNRLIDFLSDLHKIRRRASALGRVAVGRTARASCRRILEWVASLTG